MDNDDIAYKGRAQFVTVFKIWGSLSRMIMSPLADLLLLICKIQLDEDCLNRPSSFKINQVTCRKESKLVRMKVLEFDVTKKFNSRISFSSLCPLKCEIIAFK